MLLREIEKISNEKSVQDISVKITSKNSKALKLFEKLGYKKKGKLNLSYLKLVKN